MPPLKSAPKYSAPNLSTAERYGIDPQPKSSSRSLRAMLSEIARSTAFERARRINQSVSQSLGFDLRWGSSAVTDAPQTVSGIEFEVAPSAAVFERPSLSFSATNFRSEERRVGKECRSRWSPY